VHDRRDFLKSAAAAAAGLATGGLFHAARADEGKKLFEISLAQWSYHKALFGRTQPRMDHLDFSKAAADLGIKGVEYVNQFFKDKAKDEKYLAELNKRASDLGVKQLLIMIDGEGQLGDPNEAARNKAVENHHRWVDAAKTLGCHSIRVNAGSNGKLPREEQHKLVVDGLGRLAEYGAKHEINVIVENHGGLSSDGAWLAGVMKAINSPRCGTLPDFGNFYEYDRYEGVKDLMPFAKGVSAKSYDFNAEGDETKIDYVKMLKIVLDAGYRGYIGIEYEGGRLGEKEGIVATKALLERLRDKLAADYKG
jgi:sugar phosphate isomerase/epimerase